MANIDFLKSLRKYFKLILYFFFFSVAVFGQEAEAIFDWTYEQELPNSLGLNGAFIGVHNGVLIFAGGTNFPDKPVWEGGTKQWYDKIHVAEKNGTTLNWVSEPLDSLPKPLANGVALSTPNGLLCIGGDNSKGIYQEVFLIRWNSTERKIEFESLPSLPIPLANMGASVVDDVVYLVGGQQQKGQEATANFLSFSLKGSLTKKPYTWEVLDAFPGKSRIQPVVVGQNNGKQNCLYVFSGLHYNPKAQTPYEMLGDVYEFNPHSQVWTQKQNVPNNNTPGVENGYIAAAPSIQLGDAHILIFGGAGGVNQNLFQRGKYLKQIKDLLLVDNIQHALLNSLQQQDKTLVAATSFSKTIWAYHTITDTWSKKGELPNAAPVVTSAVDWNGALFIPGGEVRPGVRTNKVLKATLKPTKTAFGPLNYITLVAYLFITIALGRYFSKRNKTTKDYFLGGGRIPWWAAGLSIYATMLSAITYISQPALAYAFDWQAYLGYFTILLIAPIVITFYLPFFRQINITSVYEYLEERFNVTVRLFGSISFVLFQLVRMGIVVYLPALALATAVGMNIYTAIIFMGIFAILYTYMGGIEAVIWTDVIQVVVLVLGLIAGLLFIGLEIGDVGYIFQTAYDDGKLKLIDFRWSITEVVTWSLFLGSFALNFAPYTTDQAVVQRYMTTTNEAQARKSIWLNAIISIPAGLLIFTMGTFLYVYFKTHPQFLNVGMQNDSIFPLFITNHLPPGIAGLVIAGIYSASMSSLDSSMHSVSTVVTVDFYKRFNTSYTEKKGLQLAKRVTVFVGALGTIIACVMAAFPVQSLFFFFQEVVGLFGSAIAGIFILGIFLPLANWKGTLVGALLSVVVLALVKYNTAINFYIYPLIAIPVCVFGGVLFSKLFPLKRKK